MMDFALDGVRWWSLVMLDGYSRTIVAGAMAPSEATWAALLVLYPACRRSGAPETLISESGGAFTSDAFEAVCRRLEMQHEPMVSTHGESYKNLMETHFHIGVCVALERKPGKCMLPLPPLPSHCPGTPVMLAA